MNLAQGEHVHSPFLSSAGPVVDLSRPGTIDTSNDTKSDALHRQQASKELSADGEALPPYDKALGTRNVCIAGLVLSWAVSIVCIVLAPWTFRGGQVFLSQSGGYTVDDSGQHTFFLSSAGQEAVKLGVNVCVSLCTDCLGYIHATSLRWALRREGRLKYNSNLRLAVSTRVSSSNRWSTNIVSAIFLITCYASSSQLFLSTDVAQQQGFVLNGIAIAALGVGILGQAVVSTLCLVRSSRLIPTWSSNPLNTTLVLLHDGDVRHRPGRCMLSLHSLAEPSVPQQPSPRQQALRRMIPSASYISYLLWALNILCMIWAIVVYAVSRARYDTLNPGHLYFYGASIPGTQLLLTALLLVLAFQSCITLGLHSAELLVNVSRDEKMWCQASTPAGVQLSSGALGSIKAAVSSWENVVLSAMKPLVHWLFGLSIGIEGGLVVMSWQGILALSGALLVLAVFASTLASRKPKGPQPAAFGHLQTLSNLIDAWPRSAESPMWWGDKGGPTVNDNHQVFRGIRHAGTDNAILKTVYMNSLYS